MDTGRSGCPINGSLELLGDRWSLLVLRDLVFTDARHFTALVNQSLEGISTSVLADRLDRLEEAGLVTRHPDPDHAQRTILRLTEAGIQLVPVLVALGSWGAHWLDVDRLLAVPAAVLSDGGPATTQRFMDELRAEHLGAPTPAGGRHVHERIDAAVRTASG